MVLVGTAILPHAPIILDPNMVNVSSLPRLRLWLPYTFLSSVLRGMDSLMSRFFDTCGVEMHEITFASLQSYPISVPSRKSTLFPFLQLCSWCTLLTKSLHRVLTLCEHQGEGGILDIYDACLEVANSVRERQPHLIILTTPHGIASNRSTASVYLNSSVHLQLPPRTSHHTVTHLSHALDFTSILFA